MKPLTFLLALVLLLSVPSPVGAEMSKRQDRALWFVDHAREWRGLPLYNLGRNLTAYAQDYAEALAKRQTLRHSKMEFWRGRCWGENIGFGETLRDIHRAFMASTQHRANILSQCYRRMGIGVVRVDGVFWVVQVFGG